MTSWQVVRESTRLALVGDLRIRDGSEIWRELHDKSRDTAQRLDLDVSGVTSVDGATAAMLLELHRELALRGVPSEILGAREDLDAFLRAFHSDAPAQVVRPPYETPLERIGGFTERLAHGARDTVSFAGELVDAARTARPRRRAGWREVAQVLARAGADGIPIVLLLDFLVGFVMAFQIARLLALYGANVFVAPMVGISSLRELIPLMTAVILAGRSGAAFAAELGTMRVNEEIDALRVMGISPVSHLVVPRVVALAIAAPILTLLGDIAAIVGGLVVAVTSLGLTSPLYFNALQSDVVPSDLWTGLVKSVGFGIAIALIGCQQGLATTGSAEGVGRRTTSTVVVCLFAIVLLDTLFTVAFRRFVG